MNGSTANSNPTANSSNGSDPGIDKDFLYGRYQSHEDRRNKLGMKMAHKALDIPDDEMYINAPKTENHYHGEKSNSLTSKILPLVAAAAIGGAAPVAAAWWYGVFDKAPAAADTDTNTKYAIQAMEGE